MSRSVLVTWLAVLPLAVAACAGGSSPDGSGASGDGGGDGSAVSESGGGTVLDASKPDTGSSNDAAGTKDTAAPPPDADDSGTTSGPPCPGGGGTTLDANLVTFEWNPPDLASWPVTTQLTEVDFIDQGLNLQFDKKDGPNRWPDVTPPGWMGPLQYTVGLVECVNGQWHGSAVIEIWYDLATEGGNNLADCAPSYGPMPCPGHMQVQQNWYYSSLPVGPLQNRQPATGETIGVFVAAGNLRGITTDDPNNSPVMERSDIVLVPFPDVNGATHSF
ncbi:MAG TPA: hypothetical protein VF765_23685 [Polyangiaceae bacterium]